MVKRLALRLAFLLSLSPQTLMAADPIDVNVNVSVGESSDCVILLHGLAPYVDVYGEYGTGLFIQQGIQ